MKVGILDSLRFACWHLRKQQLTWVLIETFKVSEMGFGSTICSLSVFFSFSSKQTEKNAKLFLLFWIILVPFVFGTHFLQIHPMLSITECDRRCVRVQGLVRPGPGCRARGLIARCGPLIWCSVCGWRGSLGTAAHRERRHPPSPARYRWQEWNGMEVKRVEADGEGQGTDHLERDEDKGEKTTGASIWAASVVRGWRNRDTTNAVDYYHLPAFFFYTNNDATFL